MSPRILSATELLRAISFPPPPVADRQPSPKLARRAAAFDRVIEALTAVAELSREDIALVRASLPDGPAQAATLAPLRAADLLRAISSADRELNAELESLDEPA